MTVEERAGRIADVASRPHPDWSFEPYVLEQIQAAVAQEREACARTLETLELTRTADWAEYEGLKKGAAAIRARG